MRWRVWARNLNFQLPKWVGVTFISIVYIRESEPRIKTVAHSVNISMAQIAVPWCHVALQFLSAGAVTNIIKTFRRQRTSRTDARERLPNQ